MFQIIHNLITSKNSSFTFHQGLYYGMIMIPNSFLGFTYQLLAVFIYLQPRPRSLTRTYNLLTAKKNLFNLTCRATPTEKLLHIA